MVFVICCVFSVHIFAQELVVNPSSTSLTKEDMVATDANQDTLFFVAVEELPEPIGGIGTIQKAINYPESAKRDSIEGTVYVEAFINERGKVVKTEIVKGVRKDLDDAAREAVKQTAFTPGKRKGKPVKVRISIPIRFRLSTARAAGFDPSSLSFDKPTIVVPGPHRKLEQTLRYPALAERAGIQGQVKVQILFRNRSIQQMIILKGVGSGIDEEVLRALATHRFVDDPNYDSYAGDGSVVVTVHFILPQPSPPPPPKPK